MLLFFRFSPNPSVSTAFIEYKLNYSDVAEIVVTDMLGNVIRKENIIKKSGTLKFDVSDTKQVYTLLTYWLMES